MKIKQTAKEFYDSVIGLVYVGKNSDLLFRKKPFRPFENGDTVYSARRIIHKLVKEHLIEKFPHKKYYTICLLYRNDKYTTFVYGQIEYILKIIRRKQ